MSKREIRLSVLELEKLGVTLAFPQYPDTKAEENSRRLAACWNACEGISTETLQQGNIADRVARLEQQRDELLKIAKDVIGMLENCSVESGVCHCGDDMARHSSAMSCGHAPVDMGSTYASHLYEKARAAIASVKGGAA